MRARARGKAVRDTRQDSGTEVVLGEDWVAPAPDDDPDFSGARPRRRFISLNGSPLARKIITFNLLALVVLVAGVLYLNPFRDSLVMQRESGIVTEAELIAEVFRAALSASGETQVAPDGAASILGALNLRDTIDLYVYEPSGELLARNVGTDRDPTRMRPVQSTESTIIVDALKSVLDGLTSVVRPSARDTDPVEDLSALDDIVPKAAAGFTQIRTSLDGAGATVFSVATPVRLGDEVVAVVALKSAAGEIDALVRSEREQVLQMFFTAILVSIGLSLVLASTIANPLSDLAAAAELGRDRHARKLSPSRVRIPDLTARPDEIGRLSGAMRGMVAALYDRIEANEQFAADVAHELKNPLASLRSAIGTLRLSKREDQRDKLLDVIEHDVRRVDRLISDISNASRLDSELVKEEQEPFDLLKMLGNLGEYLGQEARGQGIDFITDLPDQPIIIHGLEARLAQVFVNLITNAISFCEDGDAIRVWARQRENRVLIVVEDTGPGIPDEALSKVFKRFYSERPAGQFGNNSGLGLAISKQIVEAHDGVIWAENIRPTDADPTSEPLGARFVVGLPV
jgi:two-component system, OmpR family, sensor histidine kinase ChvG